MLANFDKTKMENKYDYDIEKASLPVRPHHLDRFLIRLRATDKQPGSYCIVFPAPLRYPWDMERQAKTGNTPNAPLLTVQRQNERIHPINHRMETKIPQPSAQNSGAGLVAWLRGRLLERPSQLSK